MNITETISKKEKRKLEATLISQMSNKRWNLCVIFNFSWSKL